MLKLTLAIITLSFPGYLYSQEITELTSLEFYNSPPANTTQQTTNNPVQATAPQTSGPAQSIANNPTAPTVENAMRMNSSQARRTTAPATGTKPRLNPPHGQPWHRCDIAVGSPLP